MIVGTIVPVSATTLSEKSSLIRGKTLYVGGSGPNNYTKIQDAVNASSNGDTVFVYAASSPYYENVIVNKSITLIGEDEQTTVLYYAGGNNAPIFLQANGCTVQRFTMARSFYGIRIESKNNTITNNTLFDNTEGFHLYKANNSKIEGNTISHNSVGMCVTFTTGDKISANTITNNTYDGIELYTTEMTLVTLNNISGNGQFGLSIGGDNNTILKNNIVDNKFFGVHIQNSRKNSILQNNIYDNQFGNAGVFTDMWSELLRRPFNNTWNGNYWGRSYQFPKVIIEGKELLLPSGILFWFIRKYITHNPEEAFPMGIIIPIITFDRHPAQKPYDIP